jgi:hypothetical protein
MEEAREILRRSFFEIWDKSYPDTAVESASEPKVSTPAHEYQTSGSWDLLESIP